MKTSSNRFSSRSTMLVVMGALAGSSFMLLSASPVRGADTLWQALSGGKVSADIRYRYERVDQDDGILSKNANASTLRTRLGYRTVPYMSLTGFLEFENITVVGNELYNSTANGKTQYPVVADPEDTEVNQAYLSYDGVYATELKAGRQRIILDNARFVGNVGWRQNEQTFDAISVTNRLLPDTAVMYTYIHNVNRIFGEHHPSGSDLRMDSHLIHISYQKFEPTTLTAYGYLLDFDDAPSSSIKTFGVRLAGGYPIREGLKIIYTAEYADQSDFADGAGSNEADYLLGELGGTLGPVTAKVSYEQLGGDGVYGFQTPLATLHLFQGWTDKFLTTPASGIRDLYFTLTTTVKGAKLAAVYHDFSSDQGSFDYGTELGFLAAKTFNNRYTLLAKYATYEADGNPKNTGGPSSDTDKLWLEAQVKF